MITPVVISGSKKVILDALSPQPELANALRRADDFIKLAVVSARSAIDSAPERALAPEEIGIFIGTAYGPLETNFCSLGSLIDDGEGQISPTLFSHSVFNAAAGYVARLLDIHGPALTITTYTWPFVTALNQARLSVFSGRIKRAVVLAVETYSALLEDAYKRFFAQDEVPWQPGAVAWVLDHVEAGFEDKRMLGDIAIRELPTDPGLLLARSGETWRGCGYEGAGTHPLAYAYALTDFVARENVWNPADSKWILQAPFGRADLDFS